MAVPSSGNVHELETLAPAFICWYVQRPFSTDVEEVLASLKLFFRFYPEIGENRSITALDPAEVAARLASLIIHTVYEGIVATYSLTTFLRFLHDSGRWSGNPESYRAVNSILTGILCLDTCSTPGGAETATVVTAAPAD
ncbi:hypothetical protein [Arthrobacter sp. SLBN-112]|uniref:hypothetical protein n=1 Tax=Arthrobacter sp. SLBN-112 TaxID=2768452 RepID=UPI0027B764AB|nr:hypothetical protein [Arthrobacter sp. SLBN-112]MDQ0798498.1 hypothetical protein [Arthrobacter sp. SLBN-112]